MSEARAREEREQRAQEQAASARRLQDMQVDKTLAALNADYDGIKDLLPEVNPAAWKSLLFLRAKLRRIRGGWRQKLTDIKMPHQERDALVGQINACLLLFDFIEQVRAMKKELIPGKERDILRAKLFQRQGQQ